MRKFKRVISGLLAGIMLSAVIAPLVDVIPVKAASSIVSLTCNGETINMLKEFCVGYDGLADQGSYLTSVDVDGASDLISYRSKDKLERVAKLSWDKVLKDADDFDGTGDAFFTEMVGDNTTSAYTMMINKISTKIQAQTKGSEYAHLTSIGTINIKDYESELKNALRLKGDPADVLYLLWECQATCDMPTSDDRTSIWLGCDYDIENLRFVYYGIIATRDGGDPDNLMTMIFYSDKFYVPGYNLETGKIVYAGDNSNGEADHFLNNATYSSITSKEDYLSNISTVARLIMGSGNQSIFTEIFKNPSNTFSQVNIDKINAINALLDYDQSNQVVSTSAYYGIFPQQELNKNQLVSFSLTSLYDNDKVKWKLKENYTQYSDLAEINSAFLAFGDIKDMCGTTGIKNADTSTDLQKVVAEIICGAVNADPTDVSDTIDPILNNLSRYCGGTNTFVYKVLEKYKSELDEEIHMSAVEQSAVDGSTINLPDNASNWQIMEALCIYSVQCSANNVKMVDFINHNGKLYALITNESGSYSGDNVVDIKTLFDSLTPYQKASLVTAYAGRKNSSHFSQDCFFKYITKQINSQELYTFKYSELGSGGIPSQASPEYTQKLIEDYNEAGLVNTGMVTNVARNSNTLAHYVITSALYNTKATETENDLYGVYDADLEALIKVQWTYKSNSGNAQKDYFAYLPSKIGLLGPDGINYNVLTEKGGNWERFVNLLYNTEYAFSTLAFSELAEGKGWTPKDVESWLAGDSKRPDGVFSWMEASKGLSAYEQAASQESFNFNNDTDFSVNLFRCIIELHDMCEFLGIGKNDWSESIKTYLNIYDTYETFFDALRSNPVIYSKIKQEPLSPTEPLAMFFSIQNKSVSDNWAKGFALSSTFVPMETNLYEASSVMFLNDAEWISEFYYKYAFYRKALYINTDNSAIVNNFVSGTTSGTRVATLNDLLNYERDIVLTIDDNFYNANEINSVIDAMDYTSMRNTANAEDTATGFKQIENCISDLMDLSAEQILKTGSASYYSENLAKNVRKFGEAYESLDIYTNMVDCYVLSQDDLISDGNVFESYEYSPKVSYAVVSSIYRSADLYNESLKALASDNAIFKSSKAICTTPGTTSTNWRSIYNYAMLSNLSEQMKNDASSTLDLDAPIFCDLFGNIVTESGLVIIPAAANATLCGKYWTPYAVGFAEYYNNGNKLKVTDFSDAFNTWMIGRTYTTNPEGNAETNTIDTSKKTEKKNAGGFFEVDSNGNLVLKAQSITSGNISAIIQWDILNKNSSIVKQIFFNDAYFNKAANMYSPVVVNLMLETMRGAPIEDIDYTFEGLDGNQNISKYGVYMAYKLEELLDALTPSTNGSMTGGNSLVTMPNLAFMPGVEYIMLYAFKIIFAVLIVALVAQLYLDAVRNRIGFKSVGKFLMTCAMVILAFTVVPTLITWSYYKANKVLLNDETGRIAMLNYVKEFDGSEIGITQVTTPETQTELYLKLDDVSIEWWSIIPDVLFGNTYESVSDLYRKQATDHPYANNTNIITKGSGMYISVQDVFDSTDINYRPTSSMLTNTMYTYAPSGSGVVNSNAPVSYTMPYYVILDQLIANINEYNASRDITAYSWTIGANGHIMTYDVITPYLTSAEFLDDGMDILGMDRILVTGVNRPLYNFAFQGDFTDSGNPSGDLARMSKSLWYPTEKMDMSTRLYKVNELYKAARDYIADNKDVLGKVPDEVFIKVMALQLAIEYNKIFNVAYGNGIEIMNVDTRDLLRFMVADNANVYKYYSYSFARYTYEQSGGLGVIFSALLLAILWLTGFIKPLFMAIILGLLVVNCVFRKLLFKKESRCIEGYLIGCACLVLVNYAYALMLKVSMLINNIGLGSILSLTIGFIVQVAYVALLCLITYIEIKDWKNSGFNEFAVIGSNITSSIMKTQHLIVDKLMSKTSTSYKESAQSRAYSGDKYDNESIERMHQRDAEREDNGTYNPA